MNETDSPLFIENITLVYAAHPGAVVSDHADAETTVKNVTIIQANGCGIVQQGGWLCEAA